jgi:hypothetical protein
MLQNLIHLLGDEILGSLTIEEKFKKNDSPKPTPTLQNPPHGADGARERRKRLPGEQQRLHEGV